MKKTILLLLLTIVSLCKAQTFKQYYEFPIKVKVYTFHGTQESYDSIVAALSYYPEGDSYPAIEGNWMQNNKQYWRDPNQSNQFMLFDSTWQNNLFTTNPNVLYSNVYSKSHIDSISSQLNISNWNTAYGWGNHSGLYKSISYVPAWTDITGKPTIPTNTNQLTNGAGFLTSEIDGSTSNELQSLSISGQTLSISNGNSVTLPSNTDYYNTGTTTSGQTVFYLTSDKTSSGTALYTTIDYVNPIVNDATKNYTYGWSYNSGTKALTVTVNRSVAVAQVLGIDVLGTPAATANGTSVQVLVKGH